MAPNEGRAKLDLKPAEGGNSPYLQQQNYSLAALAKRDAQADPFATAAPKAPVAAAPAASQEQAGPQQAKEQVKSISLDRITGLFALATPKHSAGGRAA
jgi:phage portal protein BeeE